MMAELPGKIVGFPTSTTFAWPIARMRDVCTLNYGKALKAETRRVGAVPVYGSNGPTGWHDQALGHGPTVILGRKGQGNLGVEWRDGPFWVIDTAYFVTFSKEIDPRFFYFFADFVGLNHLKDGTSNPSLSRDTFYLQPIPVPPLPDQQVIARCLAAFDEKIELDRRMNDTLEAMAQAIFRDWFVDFGPVRRKLAGATDPVEIMGGLSLGHDCSAALAAHFPSDLHDRELPVGWSERPLVELTSELRRGIGPKYLEEGGVMVLNQKCIRNREVSLGPARRHDDKAKSVEGRILTNGDVLVNSTGVGTLGRVAQIWNVDQPIVVDSHVTVVRARPTECSALYLGCALGLREDEIVQLGEGSTGQTELSRERLGRMMIVCPDKAILDAFDTACGPLVQRIQANRQEVAVLAETRDYLLPRLMSGSLRVAEARELAEAAA